MSEPATDPKQATNALDYQALFEADARLGDLLPAHRRHLAASGISPDIAFARGYRSVTKVSDLERIGFSRLQCRIPALLLPVWSVHGEIALYQVRPDIPRIFNGKPIKYETPRGASMALDVPPGARDRIRDPAVPLFITEGLKKADAAVTQGLCCIALLGVWNFRGTNELGGKTALADWESIALNGRRVNIAFDSDVMTKSSVTMALIRLKAFLGTRKADVHLVYLPPAADGSKVGLDDFFIAGHTVADLVQLARPDVLIPPSDEPDDALYRATDVGLFLRKETRDGVVRVPLTNFRARIVGENALDDGVETLREFEIEAWLRGRTFVFQIPAAKFEGMTWVTGEMGAEAVVYAGSGVRDHARTAIQVVSGTIPRSVSYAHTGWREVDGRMVYLHAGGAIGAEGSVAGICVELPDSLRAFELPDPPSGEELRRCVRASLAILDVADLHATVPVLAAGYRAPLGPSDYSIHLTGQTGEGKTELVAIVQQHFGRRMDSRNLPASWSSTGNALEATAFAAKDTLLTIDDFAPRGGMHEAQRMHREADRVLRAQGNRLGRQRMSADGRLRRTRPPRGTILSTGEDVPPGHSLRARLLIAEMAVKSMKWDRLTTHQKEAADGVYATAMAGYVRWIAERHAEVMRDAREISLDLRQRSASTTVHRRTPGVVAELGAGLETFLKFAVSIGALSPEESGATWKRCWNALLGLAAAQTLEQVASEPTKRFRELILAAFAAGHAHVANIDGANPENAAAWGWRMEESWSPRGDRLGWVNGDDLYLEPHVSYAVVQKMAREAGEDALGISERGLRKRLADAGLLASTERRGSQRHLSIRTTVEGRRREVLHVHTSLLEEDDTPATGDGVNAPDTDGNGPDGQSDQAVAPGEAPDAHDGAAS